MSKNNKLTAASITSALSRVFFKNKNLIMVPNTYWTGYECDLLVVLPTMKVIDIEIKLSYKDFLADSVKDKWWKVRYENRERISERREWPVHVWKHYFCMPKEMWVEDMKEKLPSPSCGVLLVEQRPSDIIFEMVKNAKANNKAKPIDAKDAIDLARLASIRMWNTVGRMEYLEEELKLLKG